MSEGLLLSSGSLSFLRCFEGLLDVFPSSEGGGCGDGDHRDEADPDSFDDPVVVHEYAAEEACDDHGHPGDAAVGGVSRAPALGGEGLGDEGVDRGEADHPHGIEHQSGGDVGPVSGEEVDYGGGDTEYGADDYHLSSAEAVGEYASGELKYDLGDGLHHEEHPEELLGGPELEDVEAPVGPP